MSRVYLDYASAAPLHPAARAAIVAALDCVGADPGRLHHDARVTRELLEDARQQVADAFGARSSREVIFTSCATEAIHHVCRGVAARAARAATAGDSATMVASAVEHSAVLNAAASCSTVIEVAVDTDAAIDVERFINALTPATILAHVQLANHEVGTLQPLDQLVAECRGRGLPVHVDAAAAATHWPIDFTELDVDFLSVSGAKAAAGAGIGCLLIRRGLRIEPLFRGGAQERGRRAGLENVLGAVALGAATTASVEYIGAGGAEREHHLIERLWSAIREIPGIQRHGHPDRRAPHILCVSVEGIEAEPLLIGLDQHGVSAHSGSSCSSEILEPSPVLAAMGAAADRSLRFSVGHGSSETEIDLAARALALTVQRLHALRRA